jgi:hypothetical protein
VQSDHNLNGGVAFGESTLARIPSLQELQGF